MIPLVDLTAERRVYGVEIDAAIRSVLDDCRFYKGPHVERFEQDFAAYLDATHCVGTANCTDAIYLCLRAMGVGLGDEVIVPAMTFIATAEAVTMTGARPVFVDMDPATYNLDPGGVERAITRATRAIVPVHFCGRAVNMTRLVEIAKNHHLRIVEDCAQANGAEWDGARVGTWGDAGCFSFYPSKNLGAYGDGGAVVTSNADLALRVRMLADHGRREKFNHEFEGISSRLDAIQAAILSAKLPHLDERNALRRLMADVYDESLRGVDGVEVPEIPDERRAHVFHCYVVRIKRGRRDMVLGWLAARGIEAGRHYPVPVPLARAYARLGFGPNDYPVAAAYADECLSLPLYPEMSVERVHHVADAVRMALDDN